MSDNEKVEAYPFIVVVKFEEVTNDKGYVRWREVEVEVFDPNDEQEPTNRLPIATGSAPDYNRSDHRNAINTALGRAFNELQIPPTEGKENE